MRNFMILAAMTHFCLLGCENSLEDKDTSSSSVSSTVSSSSQSSSQSSVATSTSPLVISEVLTKSTDDSYLAGNDWIELHNVSDQSLDLSNYSLADSTSEPVALPAESLLPGEFIVIAAVDSEDAAPPEPFVPFKLGGEDSVNLYEADDLVDSLSWVDGQILDGEGFGLVDQAWVATVPTPGAANQAVPSASGDSDIVISEVVARSADQTYLAGNDWIELYNAGSEAIDLSAYWIADSGSERLALPSQILAPGAYWVIAAVDSEDPQPPSPSVPFKLGGADTVSLYLGDTLVDELRWLDGQADEGFGFGLVGGQAVTTEPSPGADNTAANIDPGPTPTTDDVLVISEIVAKSDNPDYLDGNDWIELFNSGQEAIPLENYSLADSAAEPQNLPAMTLPAGERLVIAAVDSDEENPPTLSVPFKLGSDDEVNLFLDGVLIDRLDWLDGDAPEGSSYGRLNDEDQTLTPTPGLANQ